MQVMLKHFSKATAIPLHKNDVDLPAIPPFLWGVCRHFAGDIYILACIEIVWIKLSSSWDGDVARGCLHDSKFLRDEPQCQACDMVSRWNMLWILLIVGSISHCSFKCHAKARWVLPIGADGDQHFWHSCYQVPMKCLYL